MSEAVSKSTMVRTTQGSLMMKKEGMIGQEKQQRSVQEGTDRNLMNPKFESKSLSCEDHFFIGKKTKKVKKAKKKIKVISEEEAIKSVEELRNKLHNELMNVLETEQRREGEREELLKRVRTQ